MRVKLIREASMPAAMSVVRREFGEDALILGTRSLRGGGVEVTVARDDGEDEPAALRSTSREAQPFYADDDAVTASSLQEWHGFVIPGFDSAESPEQEVIVFGHQVRMGALDLARGAPPLVVCGVPGSGKTLAVTRLATRMVLAGRDPLVVTMDTERSGAFEQLSACMDILGVELRAVETPDALKALHAREGQRRMMLVDTFGVSPWDAALMSRLVQIKKAVHADLAVVHPAGGHVDETCDTLAAFQRIGASNLIVSKTDCTRRMGDIVQASLLGIPMAEVSSGRGVIDGLRTVTPKILRDVLLDMQRRAPAAGRKMNAMKSKNREGLMAQPHMGRQEGLWAGRSAVPKGAEILARHMLAQGRV
nr:hypothetical protein [uncultured Neokomagataea sp.]